MNIKMTALLLALGALAGCGGGGGSASPAAAPTPGGALTHNSGVFVDANNDMALALLPTQGSSRAWYGLRAITGNVLPVTYQGDLAASNLTGVSRSMVGSSAVNTGTASLTAVTAASLTGLLTIANTDSSPSRSLAADHATALTSAELPGIWTGTWTVKGASAASESVTLTMPIAAGNMTISNFLNCAVTVASLASPSGADGVYSISLSFSGGSCPVSGLRNGVLMTYALGAVKHLRLVAFDAGLTESVSFRAHLP